MEKVIYAGPFDTLGVYKGGISVVVNDALQEYEREDTHVFAFEPFNTCLLARDINKQGRLNIQNITNTIRLVKDLNRIVKEVNSKIVYYNSSCGIPLLKDLMVLYIVKMMRKTKNVLHIHYADIDAIIPSNKLIRKAMIHLLNKMDSIIFLSKQTEVGMKSIISEKVNTTTIYNFHNYEIEAEIIEKKIEEKLQHDTFKMVFLGSICRRKGVLDLLHAINEVNIPCELHICGEITDPTIEDDYKSLVKKIGNKKVIEHGYIKGKDKEQLLLDCDALVLPSYGEGFPIVLLEGIACGCAIISSNVGATKEVFDYRNGEFFEPGDIQAIRNAIIRLSDKSVLTPIMKRNFIMSDDYGVATFISKVESTVERCLLVEEGERK